MKNPKVAVIIPNYNKADYILDCIDSVINQTYANIEIIIIDDRSTDNSDIIIGQILQKHPNIKYHRLSQNHGVSYARNYGAKKTDADYLVFLDADDIFINKNKIKNEVSIISKKRIAFSQWIPIDVRGNILPYQTYKDNPYESMLAISKILSINQPPYRQLRSLMIPAAFFRKIGGYNTKLSYYEDFDLQCRLGLKLKFVYTKDLGEAYRLGTNGLSKRSVEDANKAIKSIQKKYIRKLNLIQKIAFNIYSRRNNETDV